MVHHSFIAGRPSKRVGEIARSARPADGSVDAAHEFVVATTEDVDEACAAAWEAFRSRPSDAMRAALLEDAARRLIDLGDRLVSAVVGETGLAAPRVAAERDRTVLQLRMFARLLRDGAWREEIVEPGDPARTPLPRPTLHRMLVPLGPVAVFGASNFPLAYSVAGGDTASAIAAGCPVVVKGHAAHPLTGHMVAEAMTAAVAAAGVHPGFFSFLVAGGQRHLDVGRELVTHPRVRAVGFTGSVPGGMALVGLAAARPQPIPVFAEMGSVNPVFILPAAAAREGPAIAEKLAASAMNSAGQMCTCPGLVFVTGPAGDAVAAELIRRFDAAAAQVMLGLRTRDLFQQRAEEIAKTRGVDRVARAAASSSAPSTAILGTPQLFQVSLEEFLAAPALFEECFGPAAIVVRCPRATDFLTVVDRMPGSLTGTLFVDCADPGDATVARSLMPGLVDRVGRIVVNSVPTGVEVTSAMVHSGPFPACSRPDSTAVGPFAIRRWLRPVCWQNCPAEWVERDRGEEVGIGTQDSGLRTQDSGLRT